MDHKGGHPFVPFSPEDWLFACRSERGKHVYVCTNGAFGVASAAYWSSRVATAAIRKGTLRLGTEACCLAPPSGRLVYFRVMGFPFSWKKLAGGEFLWWVKYDLVLSETSLGLSTSRAQWLEGWYTRVAPFVCVATVLDQLL